MSTINIGDVEAVIRLIDQFSPVLGAVRANLSAFQASTVATMAATNAATVASSKHLQDMAMMFRTLGRDATQVGSMMTFGITAPLVAATAASATFAAGFETNLIKLVNLSMVTTENMEKMRQGVLDLAPAVGIGPTKLSEALLQITSTGIRGSEALDILGQAARASMIGLGDVTTVAATITSVMAAYRDTGMTAARATEILYKTVVEGKGELTAFAGAMGRVVGIASMVGVSLADVGAYMATFTRVGVSADEAVTALRQTLLRLTIKEAPNTNKVLAELGMNFDDLRKAIAEKGLMPVITDMVARFGDANKSLGLLFPNIRALAGTMSVAGAQAKDYAEIWKHITADTYEMSEAVKRAEQTIGVQWNKLVAQLELVAIAMGDKLRPQIDKLIPALERFLQRVADLIEWFGKLSQPQQDFVINTLAITAALGPAIYILGGFARAITLIYDLAVLLSGVKLAAWFAGALASASDFLMVLIGGGGLTAAIAGSIPVWGQWLAIIVSVGTALYAGSIALDLYRQSEQRAKDSADSVAAAWRQMDEASKLVGYRVTNQGFAIQILDAHAEELRKTYRKWADDTKTTVTAVDRLTKSVNDTIPAAGGAETSIRSLKDLMDEFGDSTTVAVPKVELFHGILVGIGQRFSEIPGGFKMPWMGWEGLTPEGNLISTPLDVMFMKLPTIKGNFDDLTGTVEKSGTTINKILRASAQVMRDLGEAAEAMGNDTAAAMMNIGASILGGFASGGAVGGFLAGVGAIITMASSSMEQAHQRWLKDQAEKQARIEAAIKKYGFTILEFSESVRVDRLSKQYEDLMLTWVAMVELTNDETLVLARMASGFEDLAAAYKDAGINATWMDMWIEKLNTIEVIEKRIVIETAKLQALMAERSVMDWEKAEEIARKYGGTLDNLGKKFVEAKQAASWKEVWDDWQTLIDMGADVGGTLFMMKGKIQDLVQESIKIGTEIPAQFKPLIEELIRTRQLFDANGKLITDISQLKFGAPLVSEVDKIIAAIDRLIEALTKHLMPAIGSIPKEIPIKVRYEYDDVPLPEPIPQASGGDYIVKRPTLFLAGEAGAERVTFSPMASRGAPRGLSNASGASRDINVTIELDRRVVGRAVVREVADQLIQAGV